MSPTSGNGGSTTRFIQQ